MLAAGLWSRARKRTPHRQRRERKAHFGELVQLDGSFHRVVRGARAARLLDDAGRRCDGPDAGAARGAGDDLGGGGVLRALDRAYGVPQALYTDWKNVYVRPPNAEERGDRGRAADAVWPDVRDLGDPDHPGELAAGQGAGRAQSRDPSGSPGEEAPTLGIADSRRRMRSSRRRIWLSTTRASRRRRRRPTTFTWRDRAACGSIRSFGFEETRTVSNDWVVRYDTRYFQVARQSGQAPARSTVLVRESADGRNRDSLSGPRDALDRGDRSPGASGPAPRSVAAARPPSARRRHRPAVRGSSASRQRARRGRALGPRSGR